MRSPRTTREIAPRIGPALTLAGVLTATFIGAAWGCESDRVGHSKSTTKRTIDTPTEKKTITETHEKETTYDPK